MPRPKTPLCHRDSIHVHAAKRSPVIALQVDSVGRPGFFNLMMPVPPVSCIRSAVQYSRPAHRNVMSVQRVDQSTVIPAGAGLPVGQHNRIVVFKFGVDKLNAGFLALKVELNTAFELQSAAAVGPGRQAEAPAAPGTQIVDRGLQHTLQVLAGIGINTVCRSRHLVSANCRQRNVRKDLFTKCCFVHDCYPIYVSFVSANRFSRRCSPCQRWLPS